MWEPCHRLTASQYPTAGLYDQVAAPEDLEVVFAIEALTIPHVRHELCQVSLVPLEERVTGPGATLIMSAFTHLNPFGSRFSDGSWGVYAADSLVTAVAEVCHHRGAFLARTAEAPIDIDLRWVQADLMAPLHDVRWLGTQLPNVYDPLNYGTSQELGCALRGQGSPGMVNDSVRQRQYPPWLVRGRVQAVGA